MPASGENAQDAADANGRLTRLDGDSQIDVSVIQGGVEWRALRLLLTTADRFHKIHSFSDRSLR